MMMEEIKSFKDEREELIYNKLEDCKKINCMLAVAKGKQNV